MVDLGGKEVKVQSVDAVRMSGGKLFHAAGPATLNARFPRRRLVRGMTRSPRAAEQRAERVETVDTGTHMCSVCGMRSWALVEAT